MAPSPAMFGDLDPSVFLIERQGTVRGKRQGAHEFLRTPSRKVTSCWGNSFLSSSLCQAAAVELRRKWCW